MHIPCQGGQHDVRYRATAVIRGMIKPVFCQSPVGQLRT